MGHAKDWQRIGDNVDKAAVHEHEVPMLQLEPAPVRKEND